MGLAGAEAESGIAILNRGIVFATNGYRTLSLAGSLSRRSRLIVDNLPTKGRHRLLAARRYY